MPQAPSQPLSVRFGPFELSFASRELRKQGVRIRLPGQPFDVLAILLEHAGEVVTREELRQRLWPADTFVDFEHGMNNAVKKVRAALSDSADQPVYIETLTRLGYRFIAPREQIATTSNPIGGHSGSRWRVIVPASVIVLALAAGGFFYFRRAPKLTDRDTIVLADFTNSTDDPIFDGALRQGLSVQLEQSPFLSLVTEPQIQQTLQMMGQSPEAKLTPELAKDLCQRVASAAVLEGTIAQIGTQYLLTVKVVDCVSGESLASAEATANDKNHVLDALGRESVELRNKLGESLNTVSKYATPLEKATTPSLGALKAYSAGNRALFASGSSAAIPFFKRAIELDPNFAIAYAFLGRVHGDIGEFGAAADDSRKAYELRDRASEAEKYFISAHFDIAATGNMEKAEQTCKLWAEAYPRLEGPYNFLSGIIYPALGQYDKAAEAGVKGMRLAPNSPVSYATLTYSYIALNRLDEAKATYAQAVEHNLDHPFLSPAMYEVAFLQNDAAGMRQHVARAAGKPGVEDGLLAAEADSVAYSGRLRQAREFSRKAVDSAERAQEQEVAATYIAVSGLREVLFGNPVEARRRAALATERSGGRDVRYGAALTLAYAGNDTRAEALADELGKRFPDDTLVQFQYLPTLRAKLAVNRGNASEAIENLRVAIPYELGVSPSSTYYWNALYPAFVRGEAYLAAHQGREAAAEFQKIINEYGVTVYEPIGSLALLGLARACGVQGDIVKARAAYQDFLTLWKDADPDIPILIAAKAEYAKLR